MARIIDDPTKYETWRNVTEGTVWLQRFNRKGELQDELIVGPRTFHITPAERRLNQEMAADETLDHFSNGVFVPVKLLEGDEDNETIQTNPNHIGEADMKALLNTKQWKAFQSKVGEISNPITLRRLLEIARAEDATIKQVELIQGRLKTVAPSLASEVTNVGGVNTPRPGTQHLV